MDKVDEFSNELLICLPVYGRRRTTLTCVPSISNVRRGAALWIYDDATPEKYSCVSELRSFADKVFTSPARQAEHVLRHRHLHDFIGSGKNFLYLVDNDSFHDPSWLDRLANWYYQFKMPVTLYNSRRHCNSNPDTSEEVVFRRSSPGNSLLLDRQMVEAILKVHPKSGVRGGWEAAVRGPLGALGYRFCTPTTSLVEHYGKWGIHNRDFESDRACNPSQYLTALREQHLKYFMED